MAENRVPREAATRQTEARAVYVPPSTLPDPTPEPGYVYRWIRTHIMGQLDPTNVSQKSREGWEPVKAEDHPELMLVGNAKTGNVEVGGLMLCKIAVEKSRARDGYYSQQAQSQMESVDNHYLRNNDPRMPLFADRKSTVSRGGFGNGT
jgi:hypothetical protein